MAKSRYPGGMIGGVPKFNQANREYVSNMAQTPPTNVTVTWTPAKLRRFRKLIAQQPADSKAIITFEGHSLYVPYARYLIEYLESQLEGKHGNR